MERDFAPLAELDELRDLVRALRGGEVDGLVVNVGDRDEVLTLTGADRPYRLFVEGMAQGAATVSQDGIILSANPRLAELLATPRDELVGARLTTMLIPGDETSLDGVLTPGPTAELRTILRARDDRLVPVAITSSLLDLDDETVLCLIISDETDHELAAGQLAASEQWFRTLVASSSDLIVVIDADARLTYANPASERILGIAPDAMLGQRMFDRVHPEDLAEVMERFDAGRTGTGVELPTEFRFATADGSWRVLRAVATNCLDDDAINGMVVNAHDVTDEKAVRDALADRERLLREAQRITHVGHWRYRLADDRLEWLSEEVFAMHGLVRGEWAETQAQYHQLVHVEDRESVRQALTSAIATGSSIVEYRVVLPTGEVRDVRNSCEFIPDADGGRVAGTYQDITEQVVIQEALRERLKELTALASVSRIVHLVNEPRRLCELTAEVLGSAMRSPQHVSVQVTLDDADVQTGSPGELRRAGTADVLVDGVRRGSVRAGYLDTSIDILPEERALIATIAETLSLWLSEQTATVALEQANADLLRVNDQLEQAAGFRDNLLSMASHELRTPLTPILGFLDVLSNQGSLTDEQSRIVAVIRRNAQRMLSLVEDMLVAGRALTGPLDAVPRRVALADAVDRIVDELGSTIPPLTQAVAGWSVEADATHLHQVLGNLLTNATKYGAPPISITASSPEPGWVAVDVTDHGPGVPEEFVAHMWDRFAQGDQGNTRVSRGVGLGLAIVRLLIEADGGRASYVAGSPDGATFTIELPGQFAPDGPQVVLGVPADITLRSTFDQSD